jgi:predicted N-formylglutamate amidohydrolase
MNNIKKLFSTMEKNMNNLASKLEMPSKKFLFRELTRFENLVSDVFDYRDVSNENPNNNFLITCEHATNKIHGYDMGIQKNFLDTHWGYDPGAKDMGIELAKEANLLSVFSNFSRLIIDPNRSLVSETLFRRFLEKDIEIDINKKGIYNII